MPHSELHERKKFKNYTLLLLLVGLVVLFFAITLVRFQAG